ncbi:MAG: secreted PhoX family phosphatase [Myxococcota bacterium]
MDNAMTDDVINKSGKLSRRDLLRAGAAAAGGLALSALATPNLAHAYLPGADQFGPLQPADANGLMLPPGFTSRVVAVSGVVVPNTSHTWHANPDGGATFPVEGGGWIYVSNAESDGGAGGVSAIRFASDASVVDAYSILSGTARNCAGGPTPWGTWLSCEETDDGRVYDCDPYTAGSEGTLAAGLGSFKHEAAAVNPTLKKVYLTEDQRDGLFYRFTPNAYPNLQSGALEALEILDPQSQGPIALGQKRHVVWRPIAEPNPVEGGIQQPTSLPLSARATRFQTPNATVFDGGEGCWLHDNDLYFSTKGNNRVWRLHCKTDEIEIVYDLATSSMPVLSNVDNVFAGPNGDVYVSEDPGNLQIVALTPSGNVKPFVRMVGQRGTEVTGPALNPDGTRLYFSSQRNPGTTYEVTGPFLGRN